MSKYSNFVGYVPDKLRLVTSGGGLDSILGISTNVVAGTAIGYVGTGEYAANPGLNLIGCTNFTVSTGCSYIDFSNLVASTAELKITGADNGSGVPLEISFSNLTVAARTFITGENIKKVSCPQLKTLFEGSSGKSNQAIGLTLNNGNTLTGEYYFPVLESIVATDFASLNPGFQITYGSGGLANIHQTFPAWKKGSISIVRNSAISSDTTATITPVVDFLPSFQAGDIQFDVPSNYTNVAIAMNCTGLTGNTSIYSINTHDNTTGIQVPNFTNVNTRVFITGTTTTPNNLTVNFSGGLVSTGVWRSFNINYPATGLNQSLTVNNNQFLFGPITTTQGIGAASIVSSGNLYFSGGPLESLGQGPLNISNTVLSLTANNDLEFSTTGTQFISLVRTSVNSASGNITLQHPNVTSFAPNYQITGASGTSGKTLYLNAPEATGKPATGFVNTFPLLYAASILLSAQGTNSTGIINVPKLHVWDSISGTGAACTIGGVSGTVITITGADITSASGSFTFATSGSIVYNFTGGLGSGSGFITQGITNRTFISGATISGNFGTLRSGSTITGFASGNASTITIIATGLHQVGGNVALSGVSGGTVNITGADLSYVSGNLTASTSGTVNFTFTGGTPRSGVIANGVFLTGVIAGSVISGNLGTLDTPSGIRIISSGTTTLTATGITSVSGVYPNSLVISGLTVSSVVSGIFPGLQTISDDLAVTVSGSGGVSFSGLQVVSGAYIVSGGSAAVRVEHGLSGLASLTGIGLIQSKTQTLYLGPVDAVTGAVSVTGLKQIGNSGTIFNLVSGVVTSSGITNFDMRSLTGWYGRINVQLPAATGFNLSSVQFIGSNSATGFAAAQMNTPALQFILGTGVTGDITLTGLQYLYHRDMHNAATQGTATGFLLIASGATSISMPNIITGFLRQISGSTTKTGWIQGASVTGLTFGSSGTTKELFMNFTASGCPLNQASVDNILQTFASLDGTNSTTVYSGLTIRLNGLCAAPSATGSGYRTTLTGAGRLNTVLVN